MFETEVIWHYGHPVVLEKEPIAVAQVPVTGERLVESVILHPRYVPPEVPHKIIKVRGYRRGRTIDILLDKPMEFEGGTYGLLNFKGVGANADREMVMHPDLWWKQYEFGRGEWLIRSEADPFDRVWGAMRRSEARKEYKDTTLKDLDIPQIPHITALPIPQEVGNDIAEEYTGESSYGQLVRAEKTNIRTDQSQLLSEEDKERYVVLERIVAIDAQVINAQRSLILRGKKLVLQGKVEENRFVDGTFTDLENWAIESTEEWFSMPPIPIRVVGDSIQQIIPPPKRGNYLEQLQAKTQVCFTKLRRRIERAEEQGILSNIILDTLAEESVWGV